MFNIIGIVISFFGNNKDSLIKYGLIAIGIIVALGITYQIGYSKGVDNEKNRLAVEYAQVLEVKMKENSARLTREFEEKLKIQKENAEKEIVYKDRVKIVKEIIEKSPSLNKKECNIEDELVVEFNKNTRRVK